MNKILLITIIVILFSGCKRDPLPSGSLDKKTFINVLVDIHIAEGMYAERVRIELDSLQSKSVYFSALKKNNVTEEEMLTTTLYYSRHPKEYDKIFNEVLSNISVMMEENNPPLEILKK